MLFNSYEFLFLFLPLTLVGYFALGKYSRRAANAWLAFASLVFYGWWSAPHVLLLLASVVFNFAAGAALARTKSADRRRLLLIASVAIDLGALGYFKYANFLVDTLDGVFGLGWNLSQIILPLGISFFTFTQIAFLVDAARGEVKDYDFLHYLLFATYFPHLIAGPILHHKEMMPQFDRPAVAIFSAESFSLGLSYFTAGLFKKTVLADGISIYSTTTFDAAAHGAAPAFTEAWGAALAYALQIYFDFSGYSDMAIGLGRMVGVQLPLNFHSPYKARSIIEFWQRWHMTLSRFLRDYLYVPLGGNRRGPTRRYVNLMLTMVIGGLWHGAGWNFVLWGTLHGVYLVINHGWRALMGRSIRGARWIGMVGLISTFIVVVIAWVPFRASSMAATRTMFEGMVGMHGFWPTNAVYPIIGYRPVTWSNGWEMIVALLAIVWLLPNTQEIFSRFQTLGQRFPDPDRLPFPILGARWNRSGSWAAVTAAAAVTAVLYFARGSEFIYFQF